MQGVLKDQVQDLVQEAGNLAQAVGVFKPDAQRVPKRVAPLRASCRVDTDRYVRSIATMSTVFLRNAWVSRLTDPRETSICALSR